MNVIELVWDKLVDELGSATTPSDGGGSLRTTIQNVYKREFFLEEEPDSYPSLSIFPISEEFSEDDTNRNVVSIDVRFAVVGYLKSTNTQDADKQLQISKDCMAFKHDLFRKIAANFVANVNRTESLPAFIVYKNIKMTNIPGFGMNNKGRFGFILPVTIQWVDRSLEL